MGTGGKDAELTVAVNPVSRLFWRRWRIIEGLDVRVGCGRNLPPADRSLPVPELQPFADDWTNVEELDVVEKV